MQALLQKSSFAGASVSAKKGTTSRKMTRNVSARAVAAPEKTHVTTRSAEVLSNTSHVTVFSVNSVSSTATNDVQVFKEAQDLLPGGVNSPVRAFKSVGGGPIVFDRVKGPYAWDVDGNKYVDYIGSWGPAIVGAANDEVNEELKKQIEKGTSFGAPSALEVG